MASPAAPLIGSCRFTVRVGFPQADARPSRSRFSKRQPSIIGGAAGMAGSARAQYDLRRSCVFLDMHPLNKPEVLIG
jgi:hypothetical protein